MSRPPRETTKASFLLFKSFVASKKKKLSAHHMFDTAVPERATLEPPSEGSERTRSSVKLCPEVFGVPTTFFRRENNWHQRPMSLVFVAALGICTSASHPADEYSKYHVPQEFAEAWSATQASSTQGEEGTSQNVAAFGTPKLEPLRSSLDTIFLPIIAFFQQRIPPAPKQETIGR